MSGKRETERALRVAINDCLRKFNSGKYHPGMFHVIPKRVSGNVVEFRVIYRRGEGRWPV